MNKLLLFYAYVNSWLSGPSAFRYAVRSRKKSFFPLTVKNSINIYCEGTYIHTHFAPGAIIKRRQLHNRSLWNLPTVTPLLLAKILVISLTKRNLKRGSQVGDSPLASTYTDSWAGTVGYRRPDTGQGAVVKTLLAHAHRGGAFLHRFLGILHLEEVSIWGEDSDCPVIPRRHLQRFSLCGGLPTAEAQCPVTPAATCYPEVLDWGAWRSRPDGVLTSSSPRLQPRQSSSSPTRARLFLQVGRTPPLLLLPDACVPVFPLVLPQGWCHVTLVMKMTSKIRA